MSHSHNHNDAIVGVVVIAVLCSLGVVFCGKTASNVTGRIHRIAQEYADEYIRTAGIDAKAMCVNGDSDGDGYVSCPYVTKDGVSHPLECAAPMTTNTGCRIPKAFMMRQAR